jgi:hypothetical protein
MRKSGENKAGFSFFRHGEKAGPGRFFAVAYNVLNWVFATVLSHSLVT